MLAQQLIPIIGCLLFSSCFPGLAPDPFIVAQDRQKENLYYVPMSRNTPLLPDKKDMRFNLLYSTSDKFSAFDFQTAYMPKKHLGFIANYSTAYKSSVMRSNRFEMGVGYTSRLSPNWHFETFGGGGSGKLSNMHHTGQSKINLSHFFLQPAIAYVNTGVSFSFTPRLSGVHFKVNSTFDKEREPLNAQQLELLNDKPFHLMFEPGLLLRLGGKHFMINFGYNFSADLTDHKLQRGSNNALLGFSLNFNAHKSR